MYTGYEEYILYFVLGRGKVGELIKIDDAYITLTNIKNNSYAIRVAKFCDLKLINKIYLYNDYSTRCVDNFLRLTTIKTLVGAKKYMGLQLFNTALLSLC